MSHGQWTDHLYRRKWIGLPLFFSMFLLLVACSGGGQTNAQPTPTPTQVSMVPVPLKLDIPQKALTAPITGNVPDNQQLHVSVSFKLNQQELNQLSKNGVAPSGGTSSSDDIANKLGITQAEYQNIQKYFGASAATLQLSKTRTSMTVDVQAGKLAQLLHTKFVLHTLDHRTFYTPDAQHMPTIPSFLASKIVAVTGLDNYSQAPQTGMHQQPQQPLNGDQVTQAKASCAPDPMEVNWKQVAHAYGYDQLWQKGWQGQHMTINLVEIDGTKSSDINTYFKCSGYKGKVNFTTIDGKAPKPEGETTLDIEMIAGLAPYATINDYQTDIDNTSDGGWTNLSDALQRIIDDNAAHPNTASAVSMSLGIGESSVTGEVSKALSQRFQILTQVEHMTVYAASGDCGAFEDRIFGDLSASYPATDTWAVGVGGTTLSTDGNGNRTKEVAWTGLPNPLSCENAWGSGGGVSKLFKKPAWQQANGVNNKYSNGERQSPDIAAVADNLAVYLDGQWVPIGGTSAATPIWAAGLALANQGLMETKSVFVYGPGIFYDVQKLAGSLKPYYDEVSGTNLYYVASPAWDYTTGLGSPDLPVFYQVLHDHVQA